jgi:hypothetical protein
MLSKSLYRFDRVTSNPEEGFETNEEAAVRHPQGFRGAPPGRVQPFGLGPMSPEFPVSPARKIETVEIEVVTHTLRRLDSLCPYAM